VLRLEKYQSMIDKCKRNDVVEKLAIEKWYGYWLDGVVKSKIKKKIDNVDMRAVDLLWWCVYRLG